MKRLFNFLKTKGGIFAITNMMAIMVVMERTPRCCYVFHQPKLPESANKFRKFQ